jgi:uncharacterized protein (TIGR02270 family)
VQRARTILWDIYEEHLDEAAFLWAQWERALCASNYTLSEVAEGPEERLLAHLDGLVLGGRPVAERLLLPALGDDDAGRVTAAAWVLLQAEDANHMETVWQALTTAKEASQRRAISRALQLSDRSDLPGFLLDRLPDAEPEVKACIIDGLAARGQAELSKVSLHAFATETHPEMLAAVLRAVQRVPDAAFATLIERGLASEKVDVLDAAMEAGTLLRVPSTRGICRRMIAERAPNQRLAMAVLALGGELKDQARLIEWVKAPDLAGGALWALAFTGRVDVAELLLEQLDDAKVAPIAAEAFSAITGLLIEGPFVVPGTSASLDEPFDDDGPMPEVRPEDDLLVPEPERVRAWWHKNKDRFDANVRYAFGEPWSARAIEAAMSRAPTWRRQGLRLGLGAEGATRIDLRQWARRQAG